MSMDLEKQTMENIVLSLESLKRITYKVKSLTIFGTGKKERDFTHVDDVVQGLTTAISRSWTTSKAHFGKGEPQTISSIADSF